LHQELALAREIQQGFLPRQVEGLAMGDLEIFGQVFPARQVAGDFYDYFTDANGRLAFFIGDVSGKGMPAALFMIAVRTLIRHLAPPSTSPAETLTRLNDALAADNPSSLFVTLGHGMFDPATGEVVLASGGHPLPLLRRVDGTVEEAPIQLGRLLGFEGGNIKVADYSLKLAPGEMLVYFTDGFTEAREPVGKTMFEMERFGPLVRQFQPATSLADCVAMAKEAIEQFIQSSDLQDDLTLLLLRRKPMENTAAKKEPTDADIKLTPVPK
jgi:phosphoserine phosphatase RsbU/P